MHIPALVPALALVSVAVPQQAPTPWQQGVSYRIEAVLDESAQLLRGRARVWYRNESPDTLRDFHLHLYLNAFRPNSAWAMADLERGIRTFQDLGPDEHGFERLARVAVDGREVRATYPFAPDSTIVRLTLPAPLPPGGEIGLDYDWEARPSTVARRQGRRGRHYDFAQWYPRVVVYDLEGWRAHPLYRQGEFYGEFATYDVTMDLARDQVVGATGVPVEGDPGWAGAAAPGSGPVDYQRDWYGALDGPPCVVRDGVRTCGIPSQQELAPGEPLGLLSAPAAGRKQVRWHARDVHHFAWSTSPDYIYEQGAWDDVVIRVLYQPGDEAAWGAGVAVRRTAVALRWLDQIFGDYPYPQVTNVHRIEGGGTEFPMVVMDGSASQGLILHEVGHIYTHGILANNEWYEGWLDEGFTSFQTAWFNEEQGGGRAQWLGSEMRVLDLELRGKAEPVTLQAERYAEMGTYSTMIYTKGSLVFWMLREMVGKPVMAEILRTFYDRYRFRHVDQHAFQSVAEEVSRRDLDWFFGQWLHGNGVVDYALEGVRPHREGGGWVTELEVARRGDLRMPVPVRLSAEDQVFDTLVAGDALRAVHRVATPFRPVRVDLDPFKTILDWNALNDAWTPGPFGGSPYAARLDNPLGALPVYRDRAPLGLFPLAWVTDGGGLVGGFQARTSYLGDIRRALLRVGFPAVEVSDRGGASDVLDPGSLYLRVENPVVFHRPRYGTALELFAGEGQAFLDLSAERDVSRRPLSGPRRSLEARVTVGVVYDDAYLPDGRWSPDTRFSGEVGLGLAQRWEDGSSVEARGSAGFDTRDRIFVRGQVAAQARTALPDGWGAGLRAFVAAAMARSPDGWAAGNAPRERQFFLAGGDPYLAVANPWLRSGGSVLEEYGVAAGGGELPGYHPGLGFGVLGTLTAELRTPTLTVVPRAGGIEARGRLFGGVGSGSPPTAAGGPEVLTGAARNALDWWHLYASAGVGAELGWSGSPLRVRVDAPLVVADPDVAATGRDGVFAPRVVVSVRAAR
ncbi:MAG: hypothetical protein AMXMBFR53_02890 [Gemmatimonadota bacterium]